MGAQLVQFPFMVRNEGDDRSVEPSGQQAHGYGTHYRLYRAKDDWIMLCCRKGDLSNVASALGSENCAAEDISSALSKLELPEILRKLEIVKSASAVAVTRLDQLRDRISVPEELQPAFPPSDGGLLMIDALHPSGHRVSLPFPSWYRSDQHISARLAPAPKPGAHTIDVLADLDFSEAEIQGLLEQSVAAKAWTVTKEYFPVSR